MHIKRLLVPVVAGAVVAWCFPCAGGSCGEAEIFGLTTDALTDPANIGAKPFFGWKMKSPRQGASQSAYRLRLFDGWNVESKEIWDSGIVACGKSAGVKYAGPALTSARKYAWEVSVRDEKDTWLAPARGFFETGLLSDDDWKDSVWISSADAKVRPESADPEVSTEAEDGTACFLKSVRNGKRVSEAYWTVAGLGAFEAYVNGEAVSRVSSAGGDPLRDYLKPGFTHNKKTKYSFTYDVTHLMKTGASETNIFAAQVSAGWWRDKITYFFGRRSAFRAVLELRYADGTTERIGTDTGWLASGASPVVHAAIFDGEDYDARVGTGWMKGGSCPGFKSPVVNTEFKGRIFPMRGPPVRVRRDLALAPREMYVFDGVEGADADNHGRVRKTRFYRDGDVIRISKGETLVVDFGQNAAAIPYFRFAADDGVVLTALPAEMLNDADGAKSRGNDGPEGSVYRANLRTARALLNYTFAGRDDEEYSPSFTFFGYRYMAVKATGDVTITKLRSLPVTSIPREAETGTLETGVKDLNQLVSNAKWGQYSNYLSVPTDCPQRDERLGWTADTQVFCKAGAYNANMYGFFLKWMRDVRDTQYDNGSFTGVAPPLSYGGGRLSEQLGWADAGVIVPYTMWRHFGDTTIVEENWDSMKRYVELIDRAKFGSAEATSHQWADWLSCEKFGGCGDDAYEPDPDGGGRRIKADAIKYWQYLGNCYLLWDARMMSAMGAAIGRTQDAAKFAAVADRALEYVRGKFIDPKDGMLLGVFRDMQTPALFALKLGIIKDPAALAATKSALLKNIKDHGDRLQTGFLGTSILMDTLSYAADSPETAYTLLLQHGNPGWLYSVDQGATTIWERWNSYVKADGFGPAAMNSFNHYAYGAVVAWMYGTMAGIQEDPSRPGFKHIVLAPLPDKRVGHVSAAFDSPYGTIRSAWRYDGDGWTWTFTIPANTTATVRIPGGATKEYPSGTYTVRRDSDGSNRQKARSSGPVNVCDFPEGASDSARIAAAVKAGAGGTVILPKRRAEKEPERDWWLLDEAILLPSDTTLVIRDCTVKLSDRCRDNFIRSANCGVGITDVKPLSNIKIRGEGNAVLVGADHPRATGDGEKNLRKVTAHRPEEWNKHAYWLTESERADHEVTFCDIHNNTYGTDWDNEGESKFGDWRDIGILFAMVDGFEISDIKIKDSHAWAVSLEACTHGRLSRIDFDMMMERLIDGVWQNIENQDGIDIRNGCHYITIEDITGWTGDDVIALTAIACEGEKFKPSGTTFTGTMGTTHVLHNDWTKRDPTISDIIIRNVRAHSRLCLVIRMLPTGLGTVSKVVVSDVVDTFRADDPHPHDWAVIDLSGGGYGNGKNLPDALKHITISNVVGSPRASSVVAVGSGCLVDSAVSNIVNTNPDGQALSFGKDAVIRNVQTSNIIDCK